jgi:hypothetical protein
MITSPPPPPVFVQHPARPTWGHCIIVAERDGKIHLACEDGEEHAIAISHRAQLVPVTPTPEERDALVAQIQGKRSAAQARAARAAKLKSQKPKVPRAPKLSFDEQVQRFQQLSPSGFVAARDPGIDSARALLGADVLAGPDGFANLATVVGATTLLHPMEGQIPLRAIPEVHRGPIAAALRELLHGAGDYGPRFDAWVAAFGAARAEGATKGPSWPLTTLVPALYCPAEHVFVKPKLFQEQAKTLELPLDYVSLPNGAVYEQFRAVLLAVDGKLREQGLMPRDLMDVAGFVWSTLAPDKSAVPAGEAPRTDA